MSIVIGHCAKPLAEKGNRVDVLRDRWSLLAPRMILGDDGPCAFPIQASSSNA